MTTELAVGAHANQLLGEAPEIVGRTNPDGGVIIGTASWNRIDYLEKSRAAGEDRKTIVTVHYYEPFLLHQLGWARR